MIARRRFFRIVAGAGLLAGSAWSTGVGATGPVHRWRGTALGASAQIILADDRAADLMILVRAEIERLEAIFSLYRPDSVLSRLNHEGRFDRPPSELVVLLSMCDALYVRTNGYFDPTVQSLWQLYAECYAHGQSPSMIEITNTHSLTGWPRVSVSMRSVQLPPGMGLTLNGIAQGFISDRIADLLKSEGVGDALIDAGEIRAEGTTPNGSPWRVGIAEPGSPGRMRSYLALSDKALATSEPMGSTFDKAGQVGHIINPRTGRPGGQWRQISVMAPSAALADGLSTAFCLMPQDAIKRASSGVEVLLA